MKLIIVYFLIGISICVGQGYLKQTTQIKAKADSFFLIGKLDEAKDLYQKELEIYQKNKDAHRTALGKSNVSVIYLYKYDFKNAIKICKEGLAILPQKSETDTTRFRIHRFLGMYFGYLKQADSSDFHYKIAEKLIEKSKTVAGCSDITSFYNDLGDKSSSVVDLKKAEIYFKKAQASLPLDPFYNKSAIFHNLGRVQFLQKKYQEALNYFVEAEKYTTDKATLYYVLKSKADCFVRFNKYSEAQLHYNSSWKTYLENKKNNHTANDNYFEASYYNSLGLLEAKLKHFEKAEKYLRKCIEIEYLTTKKSIVISEAYRQLAEIFLENNQTSKALQYYQKAIVGIHFTFNSENIYQNPKATGLISEREYFRALIGKANAFKKYFSQTKSIADLESSLKTYQLAIDLSEKMRRSYQSANAKMFFTENYFEVYSKAIETANELHNTTQASNYQELMFQFYEKSRAATLNDALRDTEIKYKTINPSLLNEERTLSQKISILQVSLSGQNDSLKIIEGNKQLSELNLQLSKLFDEFEKESPQYYQLKYDSKLITNKEIKSKIIDENTTLISYFLTKQDLYIFTTNALNSGVYQQKIGLGFMGKLTEFRDILAKTPQGKKYNAQALSAELYDVLIKPIEKEIEGKKRLIIIRDAELNYLPFEVLAKQKDDFLLKKYIISYAYSASLLLPTEQQRKQGSGLLGFAPFANNSFQQSLFRDKNLGQLPKSGSEAEKIGGDIYLENKATKKRFYEKYRDKNIIHFATHAITDDNDPLKSFIAFYPDGVDYKLFTNELYDLDLRNTSLVMLSACETGAGKLQKGEGVMSLSRAFTYAGAKAVITTLWNAHDEASAYISERFYKHLKDGLKTDEALQKAKLDFLNSELALRYEHPYYWANFILIGPAETIDFSTDWWVWGISIIFLLFLIFMVTKLRGKSISPKQAETRIG